MFVKPMTPGQKNTLKRIIAPLAILGVIGFLAPTIGFDPISSIRNNILLTQADEEPSPSPSPITPTLVIESPSPSPTVTKSTPRPVNTGDFYVDPNGEYWIDMAMGEGRQITNRNSDFWFRDFCVVAPPSVVANQDLSAIKAQKLVGGNWVTAPDARIVTSFPGSESHTSCPSGVAGLQTYMIYTGGLGGLQEQAASGAVTKYRFFIKGGQYGDTIYGDITFEFTVFVEKAN